ncbi:nucleotidyltransferase [Clostridia bacterium]|nr:nucleotidyltransferase [Clostridia bacterium]
MSATLVIMAAGMGSRFGGLKQMEPIGPDGSVISDYSVYDAKKAGFDKAVFIIKEEHNELFREKFFNKISKQIDAEIVFQTMDSLPPGRTKPWGTAHAVLCAKNAVKGAFAVINADDFYGASAFSDVYGYITENPEPNKYCMASYLLKNTVSDIGAVTRGVCTVNEQGFVTEVIETSGIDKSTSLSPETLVSMNFFGYKQDFFGYAEEYFVTFLEKNRNDLKAEFFIPTLTDTLVREGKVTLKSLPCREVWLGVTYKEDAPFVRNEIKKLIDAGKYPEELWAK